MDYYCSSLLRRPVFQVGPLLTHLLIDGQQLLYVQNSVQAKELANQYIVVFHIVVSYNVYTLYTQQSAQALWCGIVLVSLLNAYCISSLCG